MWLILIALLLESPAPAKENTAEATVRALFDAMRAGDGQAIQSHWIDGSFLDRRQKDGSHARDLFTRWSQAINGYEPGILDEQIFAVKTHEFGGIAQVHAPFLLYVRGDLVGCGVNHFSLVQIEGVWKVTYGMDTAYEGDCTEFRAKF